LKERKRLRALALLARDDKATDRPWYAPPIPVDTEIRDGVLYEQWDNWSWYPFDYSDRWRVYFIQAGSSGPVKIGTSPNPNKRKTELQPGNPELLVLIADVAGDIRLEHAAHRKLKHLRMHGEWFRPESDLFAVIEELKTNLGGLTSWRDWVPNGGGE
jgi:hypothetical protein